MTEAFLRYFDSRSPADSHRLDELISILQRRVTSNDLSCTLGNDCFPIITSTQILEFYGLTPMLQVFIP